jgi:3-oxoacyl-[acyl-carrier-protein] synthase-3
MMQRGKIIGSGSYAPERVLDNAYFNEQLGEDVGTWLEENLTIKERRWMTEDQSTSDLVVAAVERALDMAGLQASDIDLMVLATDTPDYISPSTSSVVQNKAGLTNATSFDINTACAGFPTAMTIANNFIASGSGHQYILVVGAYGMSRFLDPNDKKTVTLFADGAGAIILTPTNDPKKGVLSSDLRTLGQYNGYMGIYGGAAAKPSTQDSLQRKEHRLQFVEKFPKDLNPRMWTEMSASVAKKAGFDPQEIDYAFMTQININQIWETMDNLELPRETAPTIMDRFGYTGSAAIPMVFDETLRSGVIREGDKLIFIGSGGGLHFGACAVQW